MKIIITVFIFYVVSCNVFSQGIKVIVNTSNPATSLTQKQLQDFFLKKARTWPNGNPIRFFDRLDDSPERQIFLKNFIKRTARQVEQHWIGQKLYSGDSAPSQIGSDSMVATLVSRFPGGIGYVSSGFQESNNVKIIVIGD